MHRVCTCGGIDALWTFLRLLSDLMDLFLYEVSKYLIKAGFLCLNKPRLSSKVFNYVCTDWLHLGLCLLKRLSDFTTMPFAERSLSKIKKAF